MPTQAPGPGDPAEPRDPDHRRARRVLEPLDPPMVPIAITGTMAWVIIGLALLAARPALVEHGRQGWLWICLAGVLWGLAGLPIMVRHDANRRRRRAAEGLSRARTTRPAQRREQSPRNG